MYTHNQDLRNVEDCDAVVCPLSLLLIMQFYFDSNSNSYQGPGFFFFHFVPLQGPTTVSFFLRTTHGTLFVVLEYFRMAILNRCSQFSRSVVKCMRRRCLSLLTNYIANFCNRR